MAANRITTTETETMRKDTTAALHALKRELGERLSALHAHRLDEYADFSNASKQGAKLTAGSAQAKHGEQINIMGALMSSLAHAAELISKIEEVERA